ncbi:MAG TPA: glycosyltransferase family 39 protein [Flavobacteriales bacterium]|nr:glycosyltransferase family 39 protein [Flavobacteriales bacterium]HRJ39209.1 glycosyltransferase family 39 protein [Flavobacteriales bacterium]
MRFSFPYPRLVILLLSIVFFLPFLGSTHLFDWDEINFAECAREMLVTGDYSTVTINYQPFWEKPPLFIWMQALSMKIFGVTEFAARFPNVIAGILTLFVLFTAGKQLRNERLAWWWVILYGGSLLPHLYFKSGIIDPWFNLFIFIAFYRFYLGMESIQDKKHLKHFALAGLFLGLAVMTKGPVALIIAGGSFGIFWMLNRFSKIIDFKGILVLLFFIALSGGIWFLLLVMNGNGHIIREFIVYQIRLFSTQDAGHGGPFYYHFIILLIGCFPASVPAIHGLFTLKGEGAGFRMWMKVMFWVTLILFSIVKTKIPHYSSLCYFPLTYLAADSLYAMSNGFAYRWKKWMNFLLIFIGGILSLALIAIPFVMMKKDVLFTSETVKDPFALGNLQATVSWSWMDALPGIVFFIMLIVALVLIAKGELAKGFVSLSLGLCITLLGASIHILPKVEAYSQRAAIEYFESLQEKDVYVHTLGYKSYAHLFYSKTLPHSNPDHYTEHWLAREAIDKPAYFICKIQTKQTYLEAYPLLEVIGEKNGFVFLRREP